MNTITIRCYQKDRNSLYEYGKKKNIHHMADIIADVVKEIKDGKKRRARVKG
jgi:hypothetical protein